jgi:hypothetical protein
VSVNFNDLLKAADDAGFGTVPADEYEVEVAKAEASKTGTGKQKIAVQFKIIAGPQVGKSVFNDFVITTDNPNALGFFFRHMDALGVPRAIFEQNPPLAQVAAMLVGKRATIAVSIRQWNGADRNQVDGVKRSTGGGGATPFVPGMVVPTPMTSVPPAPSFSPQPAVVPPLPTYNPVTSAPDAPYAPPAFTPEPVPPIVDTTTAPEVPF